MTAASLEARRGALARMFEAAVAAAHPAACLPAHLPAPPQRGRLVVLAAGKAGASMAAVAERFYRDRHGLGPDRFAGLAVTRHGYGAPAGAIPVVECGHPVPDQDGVAATGRGVRAASAPGGSPRQVPPAPARHR